MLCIYVYMCIYIFLHIYIWTYIHVITYVYIYMNHKCIHIYTHTNRYGGGTQAPSTAASSTTQSDAIKPLYGRDATGRRELGGSSASTTSSGMLEGKSLTSETRTQTNSTSQFGNMQAGVGEKKEEYRVPVSSSNSVLGQVYIQICTHAHAHTHMHTHICTHTHTHTHSHTHSTHTHTGC